MAHSHCLFDGIVNWRTLAELVGESRGQVERYIRLTKLIEPLQKMVDGLDENFKICHHYCKRCS